MSLKLALFSFALATTFRVSLAANTTTNIIQRWFTTPACTNSWEFVYGNSVPCETSSCEAPYTLKPDEKKRSFPGGPFYAVQFLGLTPDNQVSIHSGDDCESDSDLLLQGIGNTCLVSADIPIRQTRWQSAKDTVC